MCVCLYCCVLFLYISQTYALWLTNKQFLILNLNSCDSLLEDFTAHINSIHPAIQFTREEERDGTIAMLDADIHRSPTGQLSFSVFRKPTHTDQYLQFSSNKPLQHKLGVIRTLHHGCNTICSSEEAKLRETNHLNKVLSVSG